MRKTLITTVALACFAGLGLVPNVRAQGTVNNNDVPGSLLIYPLFDNTRGALTFVTVTNTSSSASIFAHFVYVNAAPCSNVIPPPFNCCAEQDHSRFLSPNDTVTVNTRLDNPNAARGYIVIFAKSVATTTPPQEGPNAVAFNHLIGTEWVFEPGQDALNINPFTFRSGPGIAEGQNTDINPVNGKRDLNGIEYDLAPNILDFPRFFGQFPFPTQQSELILINLTGGAQFLANADLLIYDNNENQSSAQVSFVCWARLPLSATSNPNGISSFFDNSYLAATSSLTEASQTYGVISGWFNVNGANANSTQTQLDDPAILGVLLDTFVGATPRTAELPFGEGTNANGRFLSHSLMGN